MSIYLLVYRKPNYITIGDACAHGSGEFRVQSEPACTYDVPVYLQGRARIHLLEFSTQLVSIWFGLIFTKEELQRRLSTNDGG